MARGGVVPDRRAMLVGGFHDLSRAEIVDLWTRLPDGPRTVTVIAVADGGTFGGKVVVSPLVEIVGPYWVDDDRPILAEAARRARCVVQLAPRELVVDHLVVRSWWRAWRHVGRCGCEDILVADEPRQMYDRVLVRVVRWPNGPHRGKPDLRRQAAL